MAILDFIEDENGVQQAFDFIEKIAEIAKEDDSDQTVKDLSHRILQLLTWFKKHGLAPVDKRDAVFQKLNRSPFTMAPVIKDLVYHPGLYEGRINCNRDFAFRIIFFQSFNEDGEEVIHFTKAVVKDDHGSQAFQNLVQKIVNIDFEQACAESDAIYSRFETRDQKGED